MDGGCEYVRGWLREENCIPQVQIVVAGQVVVQLDAVLERLHGGVGEAQRRVVLLAEIGGLIGGRFGGVGLGGHVGGFVIGTCGEVSTGFDRKLRRRKTREVGATIEVNRRDVTCDRPAHAHAHRSIPRKPPRHLPWHDDACLQVSAQTGQVGRGFSALLPPTNHLTPITSAAPQPSQKHA